MRPFPALPGVSLFEPHDVSLSPKPMNYLGLLFILAVIFVNLWGMALLTGFAWKNRWAAAAGGPWIVVTAFYAVENYFGFGPHLQWFAGLSTIASISLIWLSASQWLPARASEKTRTRLAAWRTEFHPYQMRGVGLVFVILMSYALMWRMIRPEIDGSSEKIPDLAYVNSYMSGETIPVSDAWLHPFTSTQYYSFQYYAAGLLGRLLGLSVGVTYNISFCVLSALTGLAFAGAVVLLTRKTWVRVVLIAGFILGGPGTAGLSHIFYKEAQPWTTVRFIGGVPYDSEPAGVALQSYASNFTKLEVQSEPYAYNIFLGDYHPPFSGFYLIGVTVIGIVLWERTRQRSYALLVGATLTWSILSHTWVMPLHALGVGAWAFWNWRNWRELWPWIIAGVAAIWFASWVYLTAFCAGSVQYNTAMKLVPSGSHTPPLLYLLYWLPTLGITVLGFYSGDRRGFWISFWIVFILLFTEFVYMDDIYSGPYERFNTTLKWWSWIQSTALLVIGPFVLEKARRKWVKILAVGFCLYPCLFAVDMGRYLAYTDMANFGKLEGSAYLTKDTPTRLLIDRLKQEPRGVAIERPNKDSFTNSAAVPIFSGHKMWLGWMGHEQLWRGYADNIQQRQDRLFRFYNNEAMETDGWLRVEGVDYILWYQALDTNELWEPLNAWLARDYTWCAIYTTPEGRRTGFWRLKK